MFLTVTNVFSGRNIGIFQTWDECQQQVTGFGGALFKKFTKREEADAYLDKMGSSHQANSLPTTSNVVPPVIKPRPTTSINQTIKKPMASNRAALQQPNVGPRNTQNPVVVYTDGACSNNGKRFAKASCCEHAHFDENAF